MVAFILTAQILQTFGMALPFLKNTVQENKFKIYPRYLDDIASNES